MTPTGAALDQAVLALMVTGLVGPGAGTEFLAFSWSSKSLPDIAVLLRGTVPFVMPQVPTCALLRARLWRTLCGQDRRQSAS